MRPRNGIEIMKVSGKGISLGKRLRRCPSFRCVGVEPNWEDYPVELRRAIEGAPAVFYPSPLYETVFRAVGKEVFPGNYYRFLGNKINQTNLFRLLGISHPRTGIYYGRRRAERIESEFGYPFIAKTPVGSSMGNGVFLVRNGEELQRYLDRHLPAYIQEYLPIDRDIRAVLIAGTVVHAYWRMRREGDFRNNVSLGGTISHEKIPAEALEFAREVARRCGFGEAGLDICCAGGRYYVLEANMVYGLQGFRERGLDIYEILADLDRKGILAPGF